MFKRNPSYGDLPSAMAGPNNLPPIRIEYPQGTHKRDDLTAGGTGPSVADDAVQDLLNSAVSGRLPPDPALELAPFENDNVMCYRNAALTLLLHLKPMLNFLRQNTVDEDQIENCIVLFRRIADIYWDPRRSLAERCQDLLSPVNNWFDNLTRLRALAEFDDHDLSDWNRHDNHDPQGNNVHRDSIEFMQFFLDRMTNVHLHFLPHQQQALDRLMRAQLVTRRAYYCTCNNKERQPFSVSDTNSWGLQVNADRLHTPLETLLANQFYSQIRGGGGGQCQTCGANQLQYDNYTKFRYLPEILLVAITYRTNTVGHDNQADTTSPEQIDLSYLQDYQPTTANAGAGDGAIYRLQGGIIYNGNNVGNFGHYHAFVRRSDDTWAIVDEMSNPQVTYGMAQLNFSQQSNKPRALAYVRVRASNNDPFAPGNSNVQNTPVPSGPPSPQLTASQSIVSRNLGMLPADYGTWDFARVRTEIANRNIDTRNARLEPRLRGYLDRFQNATEQDRLAMLTKAELLSRAQAIGHIVSTALTKIVLVQNLVGHLPSQTQQLAITATSGTATAAQNIQGTTQASTVQNTTTQDTTAQGAAVLTGAGPTAADPTNMGQTSPEAAQLRDENNSLHQQLRTAQRSRDAATGRWLSEFEASGQIIVQRAAFSTSNDPVGNRTQPNTNLPNASVNLQPDTQQGGAQQPDTQQSDVRQAGSQQADTQQPGTQQSNTQQPNTQQANDQQPDTQQSDGQQLGRRVLKVITRGVIDSLSARPWGDHVVYLEVPGYLAHRHLKTTQWWSLGNYAPVGQFSSGDLSQEVLINVTVQDQAGASSVFTLYQYRIDLGPGQPLTNSPGVDVELLTYEQVPNNITPYSAPAAPSVVQDLGQIATQSAPQSPSSTTTAPQQNMTMTTTAGPTQTQTSTAGAAQVSTTTSGPATTQTTTVDLNTGLFAATNLNVQLNDNGALQFLQSLQIELQSQTVQSQTRQPLTTQPGPSFQPDQQNQPQTPPQQHTPWNPDDDSGVSTEGPQSSPRPTQPTRRRRRASDDSDHSDGPDARRRRFTGPNQGDDASPTDSLTDRRGRHSPQIDDSVRTPSPVDNDDLWTIDPTGDPNLLRRANRNRASQTLSPSPDLQRSSQSPQPRIYDIDDLPSPSQSPARSRRVSPSPLPGLQQTLAGSGAGVGTATSTANTGATTTTANQPPPPFDPNQFLAQIDAHARRARTGPGSRSFARSQAAAIAAGNAAVENDDSGFQVGIFFGRGSGGRGSGGGGGDGGAGHGDDGDEGGEAGLDVDLFGDGDGDDDGGIDGNDGA